MALEATRANHELDTLRIERPQERSPRKRSRLVSSAILTVLTTVLGAAGYVSYAKTIGRPPTVQTMREAHSLAASPSTNTRREDCRVAAQEQLSQRHSPPKPAARSRLIIGDFGPSDSALAAARGWRLRRTAADRHAARCASRDLCSGGAPRRYPPSSVRSPGACPIFMSAAQISLRWSGVTCTPC